MKKMKNQIQGVDTKLFEKYLKFKIQGILQ
jgi:hypothetical protein